MKQIHFWIRNYFGFSELETRGFVPLLGLIFLMLIAPSGYRLIFSTPTPPSSQQIAALDSLLEQLEPATATTASFKGQKAPLPSTEFSLRAFDPNVSSYAELVSLGFPKKIAKTLLRYREKGGRFRKKADLKKIYGLSPEFYQHIAPYIQLPETLAKSSPKDVQNSQKRKIIPKTTLNEIVQEKLQIDINAADTAALKKIRGLERCFHSAS